MAAATPHPQADFIAGIHADGADQFLISYLTLTRFRLGSPYALGFALGHAFELSLKTVYWVAKRTFPDKHLLDSLIKEIGGDLERELDAILPPQVVRDRFEAAIGPMMQAPIDQMSKTYFDVIPTGNDDAWLVLYILFILADVKFGVDRQQRVLQLMPTDPPKLNAMALRALGCVRRRFPAANSHRGYIEEFIDAHAVKGPVKGVTAAQLVRLAEENARRANMSRWSRLLQYGLSLVSRIRRLFSFRANTESGAPSGQQVEEPKSSLVFTGEELRLIKEALGLRLRPELDADVEEVL